MSKKQTGKSKAAELKDALERGQVGAPPAEEKDTITITSGDTTVVTNLDGLKRASAKLKKLKPKTEQGDFVTEKKLDVPEPTSPLYIAGKRLKEAIVQEDLLKDEKAEAIQEVLKAMRKAKRWVYKVEGYGFELNHLGAQDKIKVIKPK